MTVTVHVCDRQTWTYRGEPLQAWCNRRKNAFIGEPRSVFEFQSCATYVEHDSHEYMSSHSSGQRGMRYCAGYHIVDDPWNEHLNEPW